MATARPASRLAQHTIRAPVAGIVQGLDVEAISEVIEPRQVILEIVPVGRELVVEARISTRDIGHVRTGQPVDVKVNSYESTRYGTIPGTLRRLSPRPSSTRRAGRSILRRWRWSASTWATIPSATRCCPG